MTLKFEYMHIVKQRRKYSLCSRVSSSAVSLLNALRRTNMKEKMCFQLLLPPRLTLLHLCTGLWSTRRLFDDHEQQADSPPLPSPPFLSLCPRLSLSLSLNADIRSGCAIYTKSFWEKSMATTIKRAVLSPRPPLNENNPRLLIVDSHKGL